MTIRNCKIGQKVTKVPYSDGKIYSIHEVGLEDRVGIIDRDGNTDTVRYSQLRFLTLSEMIEDRVMRFDTCKYLGNQIDFTISTNMFDRTTLNHIGNNVVSFSINPEEDRWEFLLDEALSEIHHHPNYKPFHDGHRKLSVVSLTKMMMSIDSDPKVLKFTMDQSHNGNWEYVVLVRIELVKTEE